MLEPVTLADLFERACAEHEQRPALGQKIDHTFVWTSYAQLHVHVSRTRILLTKLGANPGDRVAIIADNCLDWAVLCYATAGCGAIFVPMYTAQTPAEWVHILQDSAAKLCFCGTAEIHEQVTSHQGELPFLERVISIVTSLEDNGCLPVLLAGCDEPPVPPLRLEPTQTAAIIYTSGTTGKSKGVVLSHANITSNALAGGSLFPIDSSDRSLSFLPWAHAFGQTVDLHLLLRLGVAVAINDDVSNLLTNLAICRPTVLVAVPRVFNRIYDNVRKQMRRRPRPIKALFDAGVNAATRQSRGEALSMVERMALRVADRLLFSRIRKRFGGDLRFAICGSAALGREVAEFVNALGIALYEGYGLTEASPVVSVNTPQARRFGTVGRPLPGISVAIDRSVAGDFQQGEIVVTGPNVMQGYYGLPAETADILRADGALRTGDMGYLDADGYLVISGRIKEQYKLENGKYVVPAPIEERLRVSPLISNCIVYGANRPHNVALVVPDLEGLRQHALSEGTALAQGLDDPRVSRWILKEIRSLSREMRGFERPKRVAICSEDFTIQNGLLTPSLKPRRNEIVQRYQSELDALYRSVSNFDN